MLKISWDLILGGDVESDIDTADLLGNIWICTENSKILEETTYLDAWIAALLEGVEKIESGVKCYRTDVIDEPKSFSISQSRSGENIILNYGSDSISGFTLRELKQAMYEAFSELEKRIVDECKSPNWILLGDMVRFLRQYETTV